LGLLVWRALSLASHHFFFLDFPYVGICSLSFCDSSPPLDFYLAATPLPSITAKLVFPFRCFVLYILVTFKYLFTFSFVTKCLSFPPFWTICIPFLFSHYYTFPPPPPPLPSPTFWTFKRGFLNRAAFVLIFVSFPTCSPLPPVYRSHSPFSVTSSPRCGPFWSSFLCKSIAFMT